MQNFPAGKELSKNKIFDEFVDDQCNLPKEV